MIDNLSTSVLVAKVFEKIIFNNLLKYLDTKNQLNNNQSGFKPGDSYVHQFLSAIHDIYKTFDTNPSLEVKMIFLDLSKAYDRVLHEDLMYKLKHLRISGNYELKHSFLSDRNQRVILNEQSSN